MVQIIKCLRKEIILWHTLLVMVASAVDHAQLSALFQLFLRETLSTLLMQILASIAVLAQLSALFQLYLRVESKRQIIKSTLHQVYLIERAFFI